MLKGQVSLVTGGGSGIGRATCQLFADEGSLVVVTDNNEESALETLQSLSGLNHFHLKVDVSKSEEVDQCISEIMKKYSSPPTVVVNCAHTPVSEAFLEMSDESFFKIMNVNVKGTMLVTNKVCQALIAARKSGSIVNLSSIAACGYVGMPLYSATKGAVKSFTKAQAREVSSYNIRINCVQPGLTNTPMRENLPEHVIKNYINPSAMEHFAEPREIGEVILFLASRRSSFVNGSSFVADAGFS